jgi:hypothetical protein
VFPVRYEMNSYILLAKIPGVARDSIRNEGTREINYDNI